ncbi:hypothetical protein GOBAR_AA13827 [Gossypium barbadense]|uniref:Uncharacterized protein n=1 Tax=Gossypium barbadense TaxID=3634 RepID=A0A2P5XU64_GOSBA|nr:hypothetical protein GOBAR_AA13827 [Gossypium barbadense]
MKGKIGNHKQWLGVGTVAEGSVRADGGEQGRGRVVFWSGVWVGKEGEGKGGLAVGHRLLVTTTKGWWRGGARAWEGFLRTTAVKGRRFEEEDKGEVKLGFED